MWYNPYWWKRRSFSEEFWKIAKVELNKELRFHDYLVISILYIMGFVLLTLYLIYSSNH